MSIILDDRQKAFENKYAHDKAQDFKIQVQVIREIAKWVVVQMPEKLESSKHYADMLINTCLVVKGMDAVIKKVVQDFQAAGHVIQEEKLKEKARIIRSQLKMSV